MPSSTKSIDTKTILAQAGSGLPPDRPRGGGRDALTALVQGADKGRWRDPRQGKAPGGRPDNDRRAFKPAPNDRRGRR